MAWDVETGGAQLDVLIAEHLARQFNAQMGGGLDVLQHPKAVAKLKKQVRGRVSCDCRLDLVFKAQNGGGVVCWGVLDGQ